MYTKQTAAALTDDAAADDTAMDKLFQISSYAGERALCDITIVMMTVSAAAALGSMRNSIDCRNPTTS